MRYAPWSETLWNILSCPVCGADLGLDEDQVYCAGCSEQFQFSESGALDLRLRKPKPYSLTLSIGKPLLPAQGFEFKPLKERRNAEVDYQGVPVPFHLTRELLSFIPRARSRNSLALDLGCGSTLHKAVLEHAGFEYVGLDYSVRKAPILGDAHSLPFADESFELVFSIAVLEHLQFPFVATKEALRVLKPGGAFLGTVAFLEPFHGDSYYHHTHLGTYNSLQAGGFDVVFVCPSVDWSVLDAQSDMGLFPRMPSALAFLLTSPARLGHRLWWMAARLLGRDASEENRIRNMTGSFAFLARKPS